MSTLVQLQPLDEHNQKLQSNVHPTDWSNPVPQADYQLVVIGAGTAGLVTAAGAAGLGARVALIERELMGGDCLNVGCVPSKGVISAARVAATVRDARRFGVQVPAGSQVDFGQVMERMRRLRADISPADSAQRFTGLGVDLFLGQGAFVDDRTIEVTRVDGSKSVLKFKKAVIATGARAAAPPIPGLDRVKYLTNESLFSLTDLPARFGIVGAGPIGAEMAQTFARFGSEVFLFEMSDHILSREDSDAAAIVQQQFERDGVNLFTGSQDLKLEPAAHNTIRVTGNRGEQSFEVEVDQLLVAVGAHTQYGWSQSGSGQRKIRQKWCGSKRSFADHQPANLCGRRYLFEIQVHARCRFSSPHRDSKCLVRDRSAREKESQRLDHSLGHLYVTRNCPRGHVSRRCKQGWSGN